jgi:hypothetical protein
MKHIQFEPHHNKTNIVRLRPAWIKTSLRIVQSDQDPCCLLTNPITSRETDSEQSGSMLVANALCWFCRDAAHFTYDRQAQQVSLKKMFHSHSLPFLFPYHTEAYSQKISFKNLNI